MFKDIKAEALKDTIGWALSTWYDRKTAYRKMQKQAMAQNFSWQQFIPEYENAYKRAIDRRRSWN